MISNEVDALGEGTRRRGNANTITTINDLVTPSQVAEEATALSSPNTSL